MRRYRAKQKPVDRTVRFVPFAEHHVAGVILEPDQREPKLNRELGRDLASSGPALTALDSEGRVLAVGGITSHERFGGRVFGWGFVSYFARPHYFRIQREAARFLARHPLPRLEIHVEADQPRAIRLAELLGFRREPGESNTLVEGGRKCYLYVRIKNG